MKNFFAFALVASLPIAAHAGTVVNVSALCATGTNVVLNAGTYDVKIIGTSQGGQYNGWNDSMVNFGTAFAYAAPDRWKDSFTITANGVTSSYIAAGDPTATSALNALSIYESSVFGANKTPDSIVLTVGSTETVNFTVSDYLFCDNSGGESFSVTPVAAAAGTPEPSTFGLIGLAFAGTFGLMRKRFAK